MVCIDAVLGRIITMAVHVVYCCDTEVGGIKNIRL